MQLFQVIPWWYRRVPALLMHHQQLLLATVIDYFSFGILLRTLFAPWKRDQQPTERLSLGDRLRIWGENVMVRLLGAVVRSGAMLVGAACLVALTVLIALLWATWFAAPALALVLIVSGGFTVLTGVGQ